MRNRPVIIVEIMGNNQYAPKDRKRKTGETVKLLEQMDYRIRRYERYNYLAIPR